MSEPAVTPPQDGGAAPPWWRRTPVLIAIGIVGVLGIAAAVLVPMLTENSPYAEAGPEGSPAHSVARSLDGSMTCDAGAVSKRRSVLACYRQTDQLVEMVFLQSDDEGVVAGYTVETQYLAHDDHEEPVTDGHSHGHGDEERTIAVANDVAAVVTPGEDFTECAYDYSTPFYCFAALAAWRSGDISPVESTGESDRLPSAEDVLTALGSSGWSCTEINCVLDTVTATALNVPVGRTVQLSSPASVDHVRAAAGALIGQVDDAPELQDWAAELTGELAIVVADQLVAGYVPQAGGGGILVVEEVAGVIASSA